MTAWSQLPLRRVAEVRNSNVDKLSSPSEVPVRLCNYVDVYRNDLITDRLRFMQATAARDEVERFRLRRGDVLITKDSEVWSDIGVPALVQTEAPDLVCGYHLTILRPRNSVVRGTFLARALQVPEVAVQLHVAANGVTRFGLTQQGIKSSLVPVPPIDAQDAITRYLNDVDLRIGRAITAQRKLVELLDGIALANTWDALTGSRGRVAAVRTRVKWMGAVPEDWFEMRIKSLLREVDRRTTTGKETLFSLRMREGLVPSADYSNKPQDPAKLIGYKVVEPGMLVMNRMRASIGLFAIASVTGLVSPDYATFEVRPGARVHLPFLLLLVKSRPMGAVIRSESRGLGSGSAGFLRIYSDRFGAIPIALPDMGEQRSRVAEAEQRTARVGAALAASLREIELLKEYRTGLTADVVTGRRVVRAEATALPDVDFGELDAVLSAAYGSNDGDVGDDRDAYLEE